MPDQTFSLSEARKLITKINPMLESFTVKQRRLQELKTVTEVIQRSAASNGGTAHANTKEQDREAAELRVEIMDTIQKITELGVELKDPTQGLLDFPAIRQGRRVYLCWKYGEKTIDWWHEIKDGFSGRQPIIEEEWVS